MILCVGTTPAVQRVMIFRKLVANAVNRAETTLDDAAGKSINVSKVLRALGECPVPAGFLGGPRGHYLRGKLEARGIELDMVQVAAHTRLCVTVIDKATGTVTELVEEGRPVEPADVGKLLNVIRRRMHGCRAMVMSGTIAAGAPMDLYFRCAGLAKDSCMLTVVDARGKALQEALKAGLGLVKPNRSELADTVGRELPNAAAVMSAMRELHERGAQRVVVTSGPDPSLAFDGHLFWKIDTPCVQPLNPIGSGDAFTAGLVSRLTRGDDLGEACRWGSAAGAANTLTAMTGEVNLEDVEQLVRRTRAERCG